MHDYDETPAWLEQALDEPPLADDGFSAIAMQRIARYRRRRQYVSLAVNATAVATLAAIAVSLVPLLPDAALMDAGTLSAGMILAVLCGLLWISTEPSLT